VMPLEEARRFAQAFIDAFDSTTEFYTNLSASDEFTLESSARGWAPFALDRDWIFDLGVVGLSPKLVGYIWVYDED